MPKKIIPKASSEPKGPLKGIMVTFADLRSCTQTPVTTVERWLRAAGASVAKEVGPRVTHLVCSRKYYADEGEEVIRAKLFPRIKVVAWEWVERSLFNKYRMSDELYLLSKYADVARKEKLERALQRKSRISKQTQESIDKRAKIMVENNDFLRTPGYDIALDPTGKPCDVILFQMDKVKNTSSRIILRMCETVSLPRYYGAYAVYRDHGQNERSEILRYAPSQFYQVFPIFRAFFEEKTGYRWLGRPSENLYPAEGLWGFL